jgi:hypothetical protein
MREIALEVEAVFSATFEYDALLGWQVSLSVGRCAHACLFLHA